MYSVHVHVGLIRALTISVVLDPSGVVTFILHVQAISKTCSLTLRATTWVSSLPSVFSGSFVINCQSPYVIRYGGVLCISCTSVVLDISVLHVCPLLSNSCKDWWHWFYPQESILWTHYRCVHVHVSGVLIYYMLGMHHRWIMWRMVSQKASYDQTRKHACVQHEVHFQDVLPKNLRI